jgi:hypothetical protein
MGLILLGNWPDTERLPRLRWLAAGIAAAALVATLVTVAIVANSLIKVRHEVDLRAMLIPNSQLPRTDAEIKSQVESLAARYPRDPRPRLFRAWRCSTPGILPAPSENCARALLTRRS